jgi:ERI1 exoribonuclease 2
MTEEKLEFLAVLDFEATCWEENNDHDIIEFPTVIVDIEKKEVIDEFRVFVMPKRKPILSDFCKKLTGITQDQVDNGISLVDALEQHEKFMNLYKIVYLQSGFKNYVA